MHWIIWPIVFFLLGVSGFYYFEKRAGNYDFGMLAKSWICVTLGTVIALTIIVVKWLS
jgi:hypothetical protein